MLTGKIAPAVKRLVENTILDKPLKKVKRTLLSRIPNLTSGFCWIRETESFHTTIIVYNYWTENYGISSPVKLRAELHDASGKELGATHFEVNPDGVLVIKASEVISRLGIDPPFEGNLILTFRHRKLPTNLPVQVNVEFEYAESKISTVHSLSTYKESVESPESIHCPIVDNEDEESFIVVQNPYRYRHSPEEKVVECSIEIFNSEGDSLRRDIPPIPACGHYVASIRDHFPEVREFLGGKSGEASVWSDVPGGRYLTYVMNQENDSVVVNHLSGARPQARKMLVSWDTYAKVGRGPMVVLPAIAQRGLQTSYMLFNECEVLPSHWIDATIYDRDGTAVAKLPRYVNLPKQGTSDIDLSAILEDLNITQNDADFVGSIAFSSALDHSQPGAPAALNGMSGYCFQFTENGSKAHVNVGFDIFNVVDEFNGRRIGKRTKIFSRIRESEEWETFLWLTNPSSAEEYSTTSDTTLTIYNAKGPSELTTRFQIPPFGCGWIAIRDVFPEVVEVLKDNDGVGFMKVRDVTVRLMGVHLVRNLRTGAIASDHLFGG